MRILLLGEFSRLHNSLKEGLVAIGHEVTVVGNGDGFKNFPVDISTRASFCESVMGNILRKGIYRIFNFDIATLEFGLRFYFQLSKLEGYDVVQLINEAPIQTTPALERFLLQKIFKNNSKSFLLCCGVDYVVAHYMMTQKARYSIMNPYFEGHTNAHEYKFMFGFLTPNHQKTHHLVYQNIQGVIASDMDYVFPLEGHAKFLGLIPNPINTEKITFINNPILDKIIIFLGINRGSYLSKGIAYFEKALAIIKEKYSDTVDVQIAENLPYNEYISLYNKAHIVLDQVYAFDQGYNALEAMAKGKVVFTGAEKEFEEQYNLTQKVAVNALPDVDYLVDQLSYLIENPNEIIAIGKRARAFIEEEHNYVKVAEQYLETWTFTSQK